MSATFDKQDEDGQMLDETELNMNLNVSYNLKEKNFNIVDNKLEQEKIQNHETKFSNWKFDKIK